MLHPQKGPAATVGIAIVTLAAILFACTGGDGEPSPQPSRTVVAPSTTPTAPAATSTPSPSTPSPTTDPNAPLGLIEVVAGQPVRVLEKSDPVAFPADMVLYFNATCYACEGGFNLQRAYRDASGTIVFDPITVRTLPAPAPGGREETYVHSYSLDPNGHDAFSIVCTGRCGGVGDIEPGSTAELWRSSDGGITWTQVAPIPIDSYVFIAGILERRALIGYFPLNSNGAVPTYEWMPGGEAATPPADFKQPFATDVPGYGLAWVDQSNSQTGPVRVRAFSGSGIDIVRPPDTQLQWTLAEVTPDGFYIWSGYPPSSPSVYSYVAFARPNGDVEQVFAWKGYDFRVIDGVDNRVFVGNALTTDDRAMAIQVPHGPLAFEPVVIDFEAATVRAIEGLPPAPGTLGGYTFPVLAQTGVFARIEAGDDCLHVRAQPTADSESFGCFASGVLLRVRLGFAEEGWTAVSGPGIPEGWVASEFVTRAAGGAE